MGQPDWTALALLLVTLPVWLLAAWRAAARRGRRWTLTVVLTWSLIFIVAAWAAWRFGAHEGRSPPAQNSPDAGLQRT